MDIGFVISAIIDFCKLWIPLTLVLFVLYKIFTKAKEHLEERHSLSWTRAVLVLNFLISFGAFLLTYLYFYFIGAALAKPNDPQVEFNIIDNIVIILLAVIRMAVASIIIALGLYFFELVGSFVIESQKKSKRSLFVKQLIGIAVASALFLVLFLFIFNWVPLGIIIYVFYGGIKPLPLII